MIDRLSHAAEAVVRRAGTPCLLAAAVLIWLPVWLGFTSLVTIGVLLPTVLIAVGLWVAQPRETRAAWTGVLGIALVVRLIVLIAGAAVGASHGLTMLGPDGLKFWVGSQVIARGPWQWPSPDVVGTIDTAHYFLFSAMIRLFDANLFGIRLMNTGLDAASAACAYAIAAIIWPRRAALAGLLLALYSPLIVMATLDVWKDPSAILGVLLTVWALQRASRTHRVLDAAPFCVLAAAALAYVHGTRSYWAFYLELAAAATVSLMVFARVDWRPYRRALIVGALSILASEIGMRPLGWGYSPMLFAKQVSFVGHTAQLRVLPTGSMDILVAAEPRSSSAVQPTLPPGSSRAEPLTTSRGGGPAAKPQPLAAPPPGSPARVPPAASVSPVGPVTSTPRLPIPPPPAGAPRAPLGGGRAAPVPPRSDQAGLGAAGDPGKDNGTRRTGPSTTARLPSLAPVSTVQLEPGVFSYVGSIGLALFRKMWGPYVWVLPRSFGAADVLGGNYLNVPGMLVWYWLLPAIVLGMGVTFTRALGGRPVSWTLVWLACYSGIAIAHYLVLNLAYRQRDGLFPVLVLFGLIGWDQGRQTKWWPHVYAAYLITLAGLITLHVIHGHL